MMLGYQKNQCNMPNIPVQRRTRKPKKKNGSNSTLFLTIWIICRTVIIYINAVVTLTKSPENFL